VNTEERVAVIAVHGVADQRAGQTVREVARLLCHGGSDAPRFVQGETQDVLVPVEKLEPGGRTASASTLDASNAQPKPDSSRQRPGTTSGFYQRQQATEIDVAAGASSPDLGIALNDYLLDRLELSDGDSLYESTRISMRRKVDDRRVDVYELYWADLSRLGAGSMRALSALYQLFFHLSTLAADVVDQVSLSAGASRGWRTLQRLHAWLAWLMKAPAAIVQLAMLLLVVFGALVFIPADRQQTLLVACFGLGAVALAALAVIAWLRGHSTMRYVKTLLLLVSAIVSFTVAVIVQRDPTTIEVTYFGASALLITLLGGYLVERFARATQGVRVLGHLLIGTTVLMLCIEGRTWMPEATTHYEWMLGAALHAGERLLVLIFSIWALLISVQIAAFALGLYLGGGADTRIKASLHTARLAAAVATALFTLLSLLLWSVVAYVAGLALTDLNYRSVLFQNGFRSAAFFLQDRVQSLGVFFTPLALAIAVLGSAALLVLTPSLLEELVPSRCADSHGLRSHADTWSQRLGEWLSDGLSRLSKIFVPLVPLAAIAGGLLYLAFIIQQIAVMSGIANDFAAKLAGYLEYLQGETLVAAGKWLAGGAITLAALGARFTQTFGRLRVALDAILDVDNYFADPRNRQPPRARIYSRFASLLTYLRDAGYARVVIVSHSQGTVISADLLRYLHMQGRLRTIVGAMPVALVTVGSPLRDLYAARFPLLYEWMGVQRQDFIHATPSAASIGATEWVNTCRSGDYVGRFLWTPPNDVGRLRAPSFDRLGRVEAQRAGDRTEFCLGAGAHTHYFDNDAVALAAEIERLIAG
jgi:hypothetical protein